MKKIAFILSILIFVTVLSPAAALTPIPEIEGLGAIVQSIDTGLVLYGKNDIAKYPPSHLTKIMTALLAVSHYTDLTTPVTASDSALLAAKGLTNAKILSGETFPAKDLLYLLLLPNAADAATVLAEDIAGSIPAFVELMNKKCAELGMASTYFTNPHGAHDEAQYTTAADMAKLCSAAMKNATIAEITNTQYKRILRTNKTNYERYYFSNNALVIYSSERRKVEDYYYKYAIGTMTGVSNETGYSIAATMKKDGMGLIVIVLSSSRDASTKVKNHYTDAIALANWAYENYQFTTLLRDKEPVGEVEVALSGTNDFITLISTAERAAIIPFGVAAKDMERVINVDKKLEAPIKKGEVIGSINFLHEGQLYATFPLESQSEIHRNQLLFFLDRVSAFIGSSWFKYSIFAILGIIAFYTFLMFIQNKRRKKQHGRKKQKPPKRYR